MYAHFPFFPKRETTPLDGVWDFCWLGDVDADAVFNNSRFAGIALWQTFDTRSYVHVGSVRTKPFGLNLAGLLDPYRRPKLAYATVRDIFRKHTGK